MHTNNEKKTMTCACSTVDLIILLLPKFIFLFEVKYLFKSKSRTANVVFFIPPAVPPGAAPINISRIMKSNEVVLINPKSIVLKPVVVEADTA